MNESNNQYSTVFLNSGRNALRYIIRAFSIKEIHLPYYTCPSIWQAARAEDCSIKFYHIDENFIPTTEFEENDFILYTNYFGISSKNVIDLANKYKNLIIDNSQAFFMPPIGIASFNSARKFFPLTDGAFLFSQKMLDDNFLHDVSFIELEEHYGKLSSDNYHIYQNRDFDIELDIKLASELATESFLELNMEQDQKERIEKFNLLNSKLKKYNKIDITLSEFDVPFIYPFIEKDKDITIKLDNYQFEKLWGTQPENTVEGFLQHNLIPIPIDFRFSKDRLKKISILGG